jgi:hypothetical protein
MYLMENTEENKPVEKERKSIKAWSENLQRSYCKSKDPNYYNDYFHKTKRPMTCGICGKTITCQMYSHLKSNKCRMKKQELEIEQLRKELERLKITK